MYARSLTRRALAPLLAASALTTLAACSPATTGGSRGLTAHRLTISTGQGDPNSLNIHLDPSGVTGDVGELTGAFFARYDRSGRPMPELVTEIPTQANGDISKDGKTIVWRLRRGVKWSDGAPFDARDVVFSVKAILNPKNDEEQGTAGWDQIASVETRDAHTVLFRLKRPYGSYLPLFFATASNEPFILPAHLLASLPTISDAPFNSKPIGTGPFRVVAWKRGDAIELEANPYSWRGKPKLDHITFKLLPSMETLANQMQTGEVELWPLMPPSYTDRLKRDPDLHVFVQPDYRTTNLDFSYTRPLVSDVRVRRAIRFAIDRQAMVQKVLHGYGFLHDGLVIPLEPPVPGAGVVPYDPAQAKALLTSAGWIPGADGVRVREGTRLALQLVYPLGSAELDRTVEFVRAQLRAVGIEVASKKYEPNIFRALQQNGGILYGGKYDMAVYARTLQAVSDVAGLYSCKTIPPNGENASRYCSKRFDELIDEVDASYDDARRRALFSQAQALIVSDAPTIMLYVWKGGFAWNRSVGGFDPPILTPFDDMMNVDVR